MRALAAVLIFVVLPARGNTWGTDLSDLWFNPNESGWGVNVVHQEDLLFLTFFLYGQNGAPVWYSASDVRYTNSTSAGALIFSGGLYQTSGPWLGAPTFNANLVGYRQVGTATVTVTAINAATLIFTVDGVTNQKSIQRASLKANSASGSYIGATIGTYSNCNPSSANGYLEESASITISQAGTAATIQAVGNLATCTYSGQITQQGRMGVMSGTYSCTNSAVGTFNVYELEASPQGFTARADARSQFCNWAGRIGGLRRGQ